MSLQFSSNSQKKDMAEKKIILIEFLIQSQHNLGWISLYKYYQIKHQFTEIPMKMSLKNLEIFSEWL